MIGVKDQYFLQFSISNFKKYKDFIDEPDLITFKIIEEAGNIIPIYELSFYCDKEEIFHLLHDGNDIDCTFGKDDKNPWTTKLTVASVNFGMQGQQKRIISIRGTYSALKYITNSNMFISSKKSGIEVIADIAKANFPGLNTGDKGFTSKSKDSQIWIQPNISDKKFINDVWLHSDLGTSFPAIGISSDGKFIIKDILKDIKAGDDSLSWRFLPGNTSTSKDIFYDGNASIETDTGFINAWMGYGRELHQINLDSSADEIILEESKPIASLTKKLAKRIEINNKFASMGFKNDNTHENYWKSYMHNISHLASFQNVKVSFTMQGQFKPIRILDKVFFKEGSTSNIDSSSEFCTGIYYVTKIARSVSSRIFNTTVVLNRESLNSIRRTE